MRAPDHHQPPQEHRKAPRRRLALAAAGLATVLTAGTVAVVGPASATSTPPGYGQAHLQQDTDAIRDLGVTGVQARLVTEHGQHIVATSGVADLESREPVPDDGHFRIASTTKSFVATVALQLVGEGKLSLDDTVEQHLPGVIAGNGNDGSKITIRHLLQNTSGIHDDLPGWESAEEYFQHRYDVYTSEQIVARAMRHQPDFAPGTSWAYSNASYVLAGMIIQQVTGHPWYEEVNDRILRPLDLKATHLPRKSPTVPDPHANAYQQFAPSGELVDVTEQSGIIDFPLIISTTRDLNGFFRALLGDELLAPAELAQMQQTMPISPELEALLPGARDGLGLFTRPLSCGGVYWSHEGGEGGYITTNGVTADGRRSVVVSMSSVLSDPPDGIIKQMHAGQRLVDRALCDAG